jgi:hypothetical protein
VFAERRVCSCVELGDPGRRGYVSPFPLLAILEGSDSLSDSAFLTKVLGVEDPRFRGLSMFPTRHSEQIPDSVELRLLLAEAFPNELVGSITEFIGMDSQ